MHGQAVQTIPFQQSPRMDLRMADTDLPLWKPCNTKTTRDREIKQNVLNRKSVGRTASLKPFCVFSPIVKFCKFVCLVFLFCDVDFGGVPVLRPTESTNRYLNPNGLHMWLKN